MFNHRWFGQARWVVHFLAFAQLVVHHIANVRHGGDNVHIELTVESLLDNLHMQQTQETATETET